VERWQRDLPIHHPCRNTDTIWELLHGVVRNIIKEELDKNRPPYDSSGDDDSDVSDDFDNGEDDDNKKEVRNKTQFSFPVADHV
jgi:hypothetical protein